MQRWKQQCNHDHRQVSDPYKTYRSPISFENPLKVAVRCIHCGDIKSKVVKTREDG